MVKKRYIVLAIILAFTTCFTCLFAFASNDKSQKENPIVVVNNYETNDDLNSVMMYGVLGKIEVQNDKKFVSYGNASAKITVMKDVYQGNFNSNNPYMYQAMKVEKYGTDYTDFSFIQCVEFDIYNATETTQRVGIYLRYAMNSYGVKEWRELAPQSWTTVRYFITRELLPQTVDADGNITRIVTGICLCFDRQINGAEFYLDAMRLYRTNTPVGEAETGSITAENEICSFSAQWQVNAIAFAGGNTVTPSLSLSKAFSSDGGPSMRIETNSKGGFYFDINKTNIFSNVVLKNFGTGDYLCFDMYSPKESGYSGKINIFIYASASTAYVYSTEFNLSSGSLVNYRIPIKDINESEVSKATEIPNIFSYLSVIRFGMSVSNQKCVAYLDNVRIEKGVQ